MIDPATGWFEIVEATNKSATSIQDLFHNTWLPWYGTLPMRDLNLLSLTMGENSNMSSNKCVFRVLTEKDIFIPEFLQYI
jgi:hypothetical protein